MQRTSMYIHVYMWACGIKKQRTKSRDGDDYDDDNDDDNDDDDIDA